MKRADVNRLAIQSGLYSSVVPVRALERFAALVAAAEREACALILDSVTNDNPLTARDCAEAIRAREQE